MKNLNKNNYIGLLVFILILFIQSCSSSSVETANNEFFQKSAIALMPEGEPEDIAAFLPLNPSIVAWGSDPLFLGFDSVKISEKFNEYNKLGISELAVNVWMLTATEGYLYAHPEYQDAVVRDISGNPVVPAWLDSEYRGIRPWWGCTNHPLYRSLCRKRAAAGIKGGANMLHLDDHLGSYAAASHSGGCFCEYCMRGFREWMLEQYSPEELTKLGIQDPELFDYSKYLKNMGLINKELYIQALGEKQLPFHDDFMAFHRHEAAEFVNELGLLADSIAGQDVPVGVNAWNLEATQLSTSHYADYFSNEVQHHHVEDLVPPFVYLLAESLNKPVFATGTGEDWIWFMEHENESVLEKWIATAYSFGNYFMYSYNKWGFSEESGTRWYQIPVDFFEGYCSFISENAILFDNYTTYFESAVLYSNKESKKGNMQSRLILKNLHYEQVPAGIIPLGDEDLILTETANDLEGIKQLIIPKSYEKDHTIMQLLEQANSDLEVHYLSSDDPLPDMNSPIHSAVDSLWILPRIKKQENGTSLVIHLLQQSKMDEEAWLLKYPASEIFINKRLLDHNPLNITFTAPGKEKKNLTFSMNNDYLKIEVPYIDIWGIVLVE